MGLGLSLADGLVLTTRGARAALDAFGSDYVWQSILPLDSLNAQNWFSGEPEDTSGLSI